MKWDRLGPAEREQAQQPGRARRTMLHVLKCHPPRGGHCLVVPGRLAAAQHIRAAPAERCQVPGQSAFGGLDIGGGLLQCQRQPAQLTGQDPSRLLVRVAAPAYQEADRGALVEHRDIEHLAGLGRVLAGDVYIRLTAAGQPGDLMPDSLQAVRDHGLHERRRHGSQSYHCSPHPFGIVTQDIGQTYRPSRKQAVASSRQDCPVP